jgi:DNA-binding transcriptional LysR family regulator
VSLPDVGMLMMPTLHGFMREYPEIQVDAEFTDNVVDVIDGGYDAPESRLTRALCRGGLATTAWGSSVRQRTSRGAALLLRPPT